MYLSFNMWRRNTLWDPAVALVAKERDGWRRKVGLHLVARMMTDREVYCLVKGWKRWRRVAIGCRSLAKVREVRVERGGFRTFLNAVALKLSLSQVFMSADKRSLRSSVRQWLSIASDARASSLKSEMRRSAVKSLLLRSAGYIKAWSFEVRTAPRSGEDRSDRAPPNTFLTS